MRSLDYDWHFATRRSLVVARGGRRLDAICRWVTYSDLRRYRRDGSTASMTSMTTITATAALMPL